nr:DUF192 domain-containing protein [Candidatus Halobonum tyrrellensis]
MYAVAPGAVGSAVPGLGGGGDYDRTTVAVRDENGSSLATVEVRIADTRAKRYTGLSDTESLADGEGMLFVHPNGGRHAYVMRRMEFPLDIVFASANGTVTRIHHAELPPEGADSLRRYPGEGRYVLEVPYGYANRTGIDVGDRLVVGGDY